MSGVRLPVLTTGTQTSRPPELPGGTLGADPMAALLSRPPALNPDIELAPIASGLLAQVQGFSQSDLEETGDRLAVLARLVWARSAELIAEPPDQEELDVPRGRVDADPWGRAVVAMGPVLARSQGNESFVGPSLIDVGAIEKPVAPRNPSLLLGAWERIRKGTEESAAHLAVPAFVRLETALSNLVRTLRVCAKESLGRLLAESNRNDAVVHFLALLELVRRGQVAAGQTAPCEDIEIEWAQAGAGREVRAS